jgi:hypothetical protein
MTETQNNIKEQTSRIKTTNQNSKREWEALRPFTQLNEQARIYLSA